MTKPKTCTCCHDSGFVTLVNEVDKEECVPCWLCDLGRKIEKAEAAEPPAALN
jgi:hypothetical protein